MGGGECFGGFWAVMVGEIMRRQRLMNECLILINDLGNIMITLNPVN